MSEISALEAVVDLIRQRAHLYELPNGDPGPLDYILGWRRVAQELRAVAMLVEHVAALELSRNAGAIQGSGGQNDVLVSTPECF